MQKVNESSNGRFRTLSHGTTLHGGQRIRDTQGNPITGRPEPTMYYYDGSAIAQGMDAARAVKGGPINYAVIGLGTGSLICRAQPGDKVTYYEIDPMMVRLARDHGLFTFLKECAQDVPIVMGDARLTLAEAPGRQLRPDRGRRLHLRRDPDPPADPRGDGDLSRSSRRTASC